jgi:hypothetical protein
LQLTQPEIRRTVRSTVQVSRKHGRQEISIRDQLADGVIFSYLTKPTFPEPKRTRISNMRKRDTIA